MRGELLADPLSILLLSGCGIWSWNNFTRVLCAHPKAASEQEEWQQQQQKIMRKFKKNVEAANYKKNFDCRL